MTILALKDQRAILLDQNKAMMSAAEAETRKLNDVEDRTFNDNLKAIDDLTKKIAEAGRANAHEGRKITESNILIKNNMEKRFSLIQAINNKLEGRNHSDVSLSVFTRGQEEMRHSGLTHSGDIVLPTEYRADITAGGSAGAGSEIVAEQKMAILPPLENKLVLVQAGATFLTGLVGNPSIPSYSGTTVLWKGETTAADDGAGTFSEVNLTPKRLTAYLDVSRLFLAQDSVGAEKMLLDNIASAVAQKLESTVLGVAAGSATQPQGMGYKITTGADTKANAIVPGWDDIVALETAVDLANAANGKLGYITNAGGRGILKTIQKTFYLDPSMGYSVPGMSTLLDGGLMNGYPVYVTNGCSKIAGDDDAGNLLVFGNWADLCIAQWGGYDITIDPYTVAKEGKIRIVVNAYFDAKGLRGSYKTDEPVATTDPDDYAYSFASTAIKLA